jgi:hypothetical protein
LTGICRGKQTILHYPRKVLDLCIYYHFPPSMPQMVSKRTSEDWNLRHS